MTCIETMTVSVTCHRLSTSCYDHYCSHAANIHNNSPALCLASSTLASTPLHSNAEHVQATPLALPSLDIPSTSNTQSCDSFDLTGNVYLLPATSDGVNVNNTTRVAGDGMEVSTITLSNQGPQTPKWKPTVSPSSPSTNSPGELRSTSRSTQRSAGHSRQSSLHSHRRTGTTISLTPSVPDSPIRRENLLALHRESCRLFQDHKVGNRHSSSPPPQTPPLPFRTYSDLSSPPVTPILERSASTLYPSDSHQGSHVPVHHVKITSPTQTKPTVMEWTSPSTRRREYEEIDRASRGIRGFWRRVAPRWCQFGHSRVPFFEEGKNGKVNYEGSVRRFRMDLPDEPSERQTRHERKLKPKLVIHAIEGRRRSKTGWL